MTNSVRDSVCDVPVLAALVARIGEGADRIVTTNAGWDAILADTDRRLAELDRDYTVDQVKSKFGGLRFYYRPSTGSSGAGGVGAGCGR